MSERIEEIEQKLEGAWRKLGLEEEPWWWPTPTNEGWCERTRELYPDDAHLTNDGLRNKYADYRDFQVLWDNTGDAYQEYVKVVLALAHALDRLEDTDAGR